MVRTCPDGHGPLQPRKFHGVTLDACVQCAGIFFDEGEINALRLDGNDALTEVENAVVPTGAKVDFQSMTDAPRSCPNCRSDMDKYRYLYKSPVMLDSCGHCGGVWVQDGELQQMRDVLDEQSSPVTPTGVTISQIQARSEASAGRAKRLERAMRFLGRKGY